MFSKAPPDSGKVSPGNGRLLAVGDIHGCLDHLERLMARVQPGPEDQVVFLGDYTDRGPDGKGVLDYLIDFGRRFPRSIFLKGNHEEMFLNFLNGRDQMLFIFNGGGTTLESYQAEKGIRIPKAHIEFLEDLRLFYETENFIFVHAGLRPGKPLDEQEDHDLVWIREDFIFSDYDWGKTVVFGHTPRPEPLFADNKIGLDTGAVYGRVLTCCDVEQRQCWNSAPLPPA
jgi:serine/threonine protein phosphatase 1